MADIVDTDILTVGRPVPNTPIPGGFSLGDDDDIGPSFVKTRTETEAPEALNDLIRSFGLEPEPVTLEPSQPEKTDALEAAGDVAVDIGKGTLELPRSIGGGVRDAAQEFSDTLFNLTEPVAEFLEKQLPLGSVKIDDDGNVEFVKGFGTGKLSLPEIGEGKTVTGGVVRSITQFFAGFLPALKAAKALGIGQKVEKGAKAIKAGEKVAKGAGTFTEIEAAAALGSAAVFDAQEDRLSNLIQEVPALENPINEFLAASPDDSEALGKFKLALEGLGLAAFVQPLVVGVRALAAARRLRKTKAEVAAGKPAEDVGEAITERDIMLVGEPGKPLIEAADKAAAAEFKTAGGKIPERAININLGKLDTPDDVKKAIAATARVFKGSIDEARRGAVTNKETARLADELGMTAEDLLKRRKGDAFNAEQALGARRILASSGEQLVALAKKAATTNATEKDVLAFRKALSLHAGIQAQVSGLTAEAGRALQAFKITAQGRASLDRNIRQLLDASGGLDFSRKMAARLAAAGDELTLQQLNKIARGGFLAKTQDAFLEVWINGLLSGPQTQVVNLMSNTLTAMWQIPERFIASQIARVTGREGVVAGEAKAQFFGMIQGFREGLVLAAKTLRTGEPADAVTKIDLPTRRAISADAFNLSGVPGQAVDFLGEVIRLPGRFLFAGDDLFKAVGYRMELNAQAFRQATGEGLEGKALASRMAEIVEHPPENIKLASIDAAQYQTFTKQLGEAGQGVQQTLSDIPALRLIMPFVRTPTNIMKFVGERTPLAFLSRAVRADIAAGGSRQQLALARIAMGSMTMATAADLAAQGLITGNGPVDRSMRSVWLQTHQANSVKIGDKWISFSRLDPIGSFLGIAADMTEIMGQVDDLDGAEIAVAAVMAISRNVTSKTYLRGLSEFFEVMSAPERRGRLFIKKFAGTLIPFTTLTATIARTTGIPGVVEGDPVLRDTRAVRAWDEFMNQIKSRVPGYSTDLPPRRNIWGEPIVLSGGIGPDIMSPFYSNDVKLDPVADELLRLGMPVRMPARAMRGVQLEPFEYSRLVELAGNAAKNPSTGLGLKDTLGRLIKSPEYKEATDGPDGGKALLINENILAFRSLARAMLIDENRNLQNVIEGRIRDRARALGVQ